YYQIMPRCEQCGHTVSSTAQFCSQDTCGAAITSVEKEDELQILAVEPRRSLPTSNQYISQEVRAQKERARVKDRKSKELLPQSRYGIDPRNEVKLEKRQVELYVSERGLHPARLPSAYMNIKFNPRESVANWSNWIKSYARKFQGWEDRKDADFLVEDETRRAWAGTVVGSLPPVQAALEQTETADVQMLLNEIDSKARMVFVFPILNIRQALNIKTEQPSSKLTSFLALPTTTGHRLKRQKSSENQEIGLKEESTDADISFEVKQEDHESDTEELDMTSKKSQDQVQDLPADSLLEIRRTNRKRIAVKR
ncbi:MAG: hypothetical protein M4579_007314, partial [Chaenotheca gracillima]